MSGTGRWGWGGGGTFEQGKFVELIHPRQVLHNIVMSQAHLTNLVNFVC